MKQKLVSIYLVDSDTQDCEVKEHLAHELNRGWRVKDFKPLDGSGGGDTSYSGGWIVVLLEKCKEPTGGY